VAASLDERKDLRRHESQTVLKGLLENAPVGARANHLRKRRGLKSIKGNEVHLGPVGMRWLLSGSSWQEIRRSNVPIVVPINEMLFGGRPDDWPTNTRLVDSIFLRSEASSLCPAISSFVDQVRTAGRKVIALGFSSMPVSREGLLKISLRLIRSCEKEVCILALGSAKSAAAPSPRRSSSRENADDLETQAAEAVAAGRLLLVPGGAPYEHLFPLMDAVVVHGGLGSTCEAMLAKVPCIVTGVLLMDQRFWGSRCHALKVGPYPVHISEFPKRCVDFVNFALKDNSPWAINAQALGDKLRQMAVGDETGVLRNVQAVVELAEKAKPFVFTDSEVGSLSALRMVRDAGMDLATAVSSSFIPRRWRSSESSHLSAAASSPALHHDEDLVEVEQKPQLHSDDETTAQRPQSGRKSWVTNWLVPRSRPASPPRSASAPPGSSRIFSTCAQFNSAAGQDLQQHAIQFV